MIANNENELKLIIHLILNVHLIMMINSSIFLRIICLTHFSWKSLTLIMAKCNSLLITSRSSAFMHSAFEGVESFKVIFCFITRTWTVQNKKEPSIFAKLQSKHRQVISSKFPKRFRDAGDLVMFYDFFFCDFSGFFQFFKNPSYHP